MRTRFLSCGSILLLLIAQGMRAQSGWHVEAGTSIPYNVPCPLVIRQEGQPVIHMVARYASEPFVVPVCWVWRVGYRSDRQLWELEADHHKVVLVNNPPGVVYFAVTHGLNLVTINHGWETGDVIVRAGGGIVVAHPENVVRGRRLSENGGIFHGGYYVCGMVLGLSVSKQFAVTNVFILACELKSAVSRSSVPVSGGTARVDNQVVQLTITAGIRWGG
jgi:hypothetical protein